MRLFRSSVKNTLDKMGYELNRKRPEVRSGATFPSDPFEAQRVLLDRAKKSDVVIYDVGANKGQTTKKYRSLFPSSKIYSFEPFPETAEILREKLKDDSDVHVVQKAVSDKNDTEDFFVNGLDATNSLLSRPKDARRYFPKKGETLDVITVDTVTIDSLRSEIELGRIDVLKFDIQGGELKALHGAKETLSEGGLSVIYTEIMFVPHYEKGPLFHEVWSYLSKYGFSLFDIYNLHRAQNGQLRYGDALFICESLRDRVIDLFPDEP